MRPMNALLLTSALTFADACELFLPLSVSDDVADGYIERNRNFYRLYLEGGVWKAHHSHSAYTSRVEALDDNGVVNGTEADRINDAREHTDMRVNLIAQETLTEPQFQSANAMLSYLQAHPDAYDRNLFGHTPSHANIRDWSKFDAEKGYSAGPVDGTQLPDVVRIDTVEGSTSVTVHTSALLPMNALANNSAVRLIYTGSAMTINGIPATEFISHPDAGVPVSNVQAASFDITVSTAASATGSVQATAELNTKPGFLAPSQYFVNEFTYFLACRDDGTVDVQLFYRFMIPSERDAPGMRYLVQEYWEGDGWVHRHPTPSPYGYNAMTGALPDGFDPSKFDEWGDLSSDRFYKHALIPLGRKELFHTFDAMEEALGLGDLSPWRKALDAGQFSHTVYSSEERYTMPSYGGYAIDFSTEMWVQATSSTLMYARLREDGVANTVGLYIARPYELYTGSDMTGYLIEQLAILNQDRVVDGPDIVPDTTIGIYSTSAGATQYTTRTKHILQFNGTALYRGLLAYFPDRSDGARWRLLPPAKNELGEQYLSFQSLSD